MLTDPLPTQLINASQLSDGDFARFSQLLLDRCGLRFADERRTELEMGVQRAFAASICTSLDEYDSSLLDLQHDGLEAALYHLQRQMPQALKSLDNARRLRETHFVEEVIPESGGMATGRLRKTVIRRQQEWR